MYIIKTVGERGIESCGFATHSKDKMEEYCVEVMANLSASVKRIDVYICNERDWETTFMPRHGLNVFVPGMALFKEITVGMNPRTRIR